MRFLRSAVLLAATLASTVASTACSRAVPSSDNGSHSQDDHGSVQAAPSAADGFYRLLNLSHANYVPLSASELASQSEVIATGSLVAVAEGMSVRSKTAQVPTGLNTIVVALDVKEAIKGTKVGERLYIEFIHGGALPVETYAARLTPEPITVFLTPAVWFESDEVEYLNVGSGHPEGTTLYSLKTPQGLIIARAGELSQPLEGAEPLQVFSGATMDSLQDIETWYDEGAPALAASPDAGVH
jgi:hypothetical protein